MIVLFSFSRFFLMFVLLSTCILFPASVSATPVSLHFQDAEIADALQAVARFGGYGIVIDGETAGRVTIDAEAEPADFLPRLAKMYGLTATLKGGTFFVTSAAHARRARGVRVPCALQRAGRFASGAKFNAQKRRKSGRDGE